MLKGTLEIIWSNSSPENLATWVEEKRCGLPLRRPGAIRGSDLTSLSISFLTGKMELKHFCLSVLW